MAKIILGVLIGLILVTDTGHRLVKMQWNHMKQVAVVVYNGATK
jgi:hypothetical protein